MPDPEYYKFAEIVSCASQFIYEECLRGIASGHNYMPEETDHIVEIGESALASYIVVRVN